MPAGAVEDDDGMSAGSDAAADLVEMTLHGVGIGERQDERGPGAPRGADGTEDVDPGVATVARRAGPCAAPRPEAGGGALLADPRLVLEPDLDRLAGGVLGQRRRHQAGEVFLNASCAAGSLAG